MKKIVIIGAGDYGRTALHILRLTEQGAAVAGFIDDRATGRVEGTAVLGTVEWAKAHPEYSYVVAVASPADRKAIVERLAPAELSYLGVIHPSVIVGAGTTLGRGVVLNAGVILEGTPVEVVGHEIFEEILAVASGKKTKSEINGVGEEEFAPWSIGPTL